MNKELLMVFLPGISWILFALGGTQISDKIKGWKGWRRFILPFVYGLFVLISGVNIWWKILITMAIAGITYSFGYGDKTPKWLKVIVLSSYGLVSVAIGLSIWNLFTAIGANVLFKLSNTKWSANIFVWKICEGFFGLLCGIQLAYVLMR